MSNLTPQSTIEDVFNFLEGAGEEGSRVQVVPVTLKQQADDTQLAIFIKGEHRTASVIMAELMTRIDELFDFSQQAAASEDDKPTIITP